MAWLVSIREIEENKSSKTKPEVKFWLSFFITSMWGFAAGNLLDKLPLCIYIHVLLGRFGSANTEPPVESAYSETWRNHVNQTSSWLIKLLMCPRLSCTYCLFPGPIYNKILWTIIEVEKKDIHLYSHLLIKCAPIFFLNFLNFCRSQSFRMQFSL